MAAGPATLAAHQIQNLVSHVAGVRDGHAADVHQARVSTRRLRELLPLVAAERGRSMNHLRDLVRDLGRAMGSVRELDTLLTLSDRLMEIHPTGAAALAGVRARLREEREQAARRLVKRLDRVDFDILARDVPGPRSAFGHDSGDWKHAVVERIDARAGRLERAIEHASGVYLPNRLHRVRIHLKKLRYVTEIAEQTGVWQTGRLRRDASRLQDLLGDIHDLQVLSERLETADSDSGLRWIVRADIRARHAQ